VENEKKSSGKVTVFFRDTNLSNENLKKYAKGIILREPTFCDTTFKFGGLLGYHRYLFYGSNARCIDEYSVHPEWGLCIWQRDTLFKVADNYTVGEYSQIFLVEILKAEYNIVNTPEYESMTDDLVPKARKLFREALQKPPIPELNTKEWKERLEDPIGIDDFGNYYSTEEKLG
jgi:hypothetical protein